MSTQNESGFRTLQATAVAILAGTRLDYTAAGLVQAAGATNASIGVAYADCAASEYVVVRLWSADGDHFVTASVNNIAKGDLLYPAAAGKVTNIAAGNAIGVATEASTVVNQIIVMVPMR